jgi:hypothetical protein
VGASSSTSAYLPSDDWAGSGPLTGTRAARIVATMEPERPALGEPDPWRAVLRDDPNRWVTALTIGLYAKTSPRDIQGAVESLPDRTARTEPMREMLRKTVTDGVASRSATIGLEHATRESTQVVVTKDWAGGELNSRHTDFQANASARRCV